MLRASPVRRAVRRARLALLVTPAHAPALALAIALVLAVSGCGSARRAQTSPEVAIWGSSSAERLVTQGDLARVLGVDVYDGGVGGELAPVIAARQGGSPALLEVAGGTIPASGTVPVTNRTFGARRDFTLPGSLAGVEGTLRSAGDGYVFDRREGGSAVPATGPLPLVSDASVAHQGDVTILWMGKNDLRVPQWRRADEKTQDAWVYAQAHAGRALVLGHFADADMTVGTPTRTAFDALQQAYVAEYGSWFLDVAGYVGSPQVWADTSITPTAADLAAQRAGTLPPSLDDGAGQHLSRAGYRAVAEHLVRPRLRELGWLR